MMCNSKFANFIKDIKTTRNWVTIEVEGLMISLYNIFAESTKHYI